MEARRGADVGSTNLDAIVSEAYVALGRLNHAKKKLRKESEALKVTVQENIGSVHDEARDKVERQYAVLLKDLQDRYHRSLSELEMHRNAVGEPSQRCIALLDGAENAADRAGESLKRILNNAGDGDSELQKLLPHALKDAAGVLAVSAGLDGLTIPPIEPVPAEELPVSRLQGVKLIEETQMQDSSVTTHTVEHRRCTCPAGCRCRGCRRRRRWEAQGRSIAPSLIQTCSCQLEPNQKDLKVAYKILYREATRLRAALKEGDRMRQILIKETSSLRESENDLQRRMRVLETEKNSALTESANRDARLQKAEQTVYTLKNSVQKLKSELEIRHAQSLVLSGRLRALQGYTINAAQAAGGKQHIYENISEKSSKYSPVHRHTHRYNKGSVSSRSVSEIGDLAPLNITEVSELQHERHALAKQVATLQEQLYGKHDRRPHHGRRKHVNSGAVQGTQINRRENNPISEADSVLNSTFEQEEERCRSPISDTLSISVSGATSPYSVIADESWLS